MTDCLLLASCAICVCKSKMIEDAFYAAYSIHVIFIAQWFGIYRHALYAAKMYCKHGSFANMI